MNKNKWKVPVIVAMIGLVGTLLTALIQQLDSIFSDDETVALDVDVIRLASAIKDSLRINDSVDIGPSFDFAPVRELYDMELDKNGYNVSPKSLDYFAELATDPYVKPIDVFPSLDLKVVNNTRHSVIISKAFIEVEQSSPNRSPLLYIYDGRCKETGTIYIDNEGWGDAENVMMKYRICSVSVVDSDRDIDDRIAKSQYFHESIGAVLRSSRVPLWNEIGTIGFHELVKWNLARDSIEKILDDSGWKKFPQGLESADRNDAMLDDAWKTWETIMDSLTRAEGSLTSHEPWPWIYVEGSVSYDYHTFQGKIQHINLPFQTTVPLYRDCGDFLPKMYSYVAPAFETTGEQYSLIVPVSRILKTGEGDRFSIMLTAEESSDHCFRVRLLYNGNQSVYSKWIRLGLILPRTIAERFDRHKRRHD